VPECIFCAPPPERIAATSKIAYALRDAFPVTHGHTLIIPKRHVADWFSLTPDELLACNELLHEVRTHLLDEDPLIGGFNIGANVGEAGGQTIFHCHIHLIPRRAGDVPEPRGGIRHVIPGKGSY
jgi:diadenosine tetraphosphate (Ap4A) HIT family hydrolase